MKKIAVAAVEGIESYSPGLSSRTHLSRQSILTLLSHLDFVQVER
ncbi:MAG TPA: hypothetical protein VIF82_06295 [Burkholderiaceae bacterium]